MDLKRTIIIKNEFSIKRGNRGTRGKTPGDYVKRYVAMDEKAETLFASTFKKYYVFDYMARAEATEEL